MAEQITTEQFISQLHTLLSMLAQSTAKVTINSVHVQWVHPMGQSSRVADIQLDIQKRVG